MKKHNSRKLKRAIVTALSASLVFGSIGSMPLYVNAKAEANIEAEEVTFGEVPGSRIPTIDHDQYMVFFKSQDGRMCDEHRCKLGETDVTPANWIVTNIQSEKNGWGQEVIDPIAGWRSTLDGKVYATDAIPAVTAPVSYYAVFESELKGSSDDVVTDETKDPSTDETEDPVIDETEDPVIDETEDPVIDETEDPVIDETEDPVIDETEDPVIDETEDPVTDETEDPSTDEPDVTVGYAEIPGSKIPTTDQNQIMVFFKNENGQMVDEHRCKYGETGVKPAEWITTNSLYDKNGWGQQVTDKLVGWRSTLDGKVYTADKIPAVTEPVSYYATFESTLENPYIPSTPVKPNDPVTPGDDKDPVTPGENEEPAEKVEYNESDDWLHCEGNKILDKDGNQVYLTGANWFGFNCTERVFHGLWGGNLTEIVYGMADHGINIVRVPISTELLLEWKNGQEKEVDFNRPGNLELHHKDGTYFTSREVFDYFLDLCDINGIKVMMDLHSVEADNNGHMYALWYGAGGFTTKDWIEGWTWFVEEYKNDDTIIACDLKNEPHGKFSKDEDAKAKWDDSTDENNWAYAASRCAKAILDINPNLLILVEGIEETPREGFDYNAGPQKSDQDPKEIKKWYGAWWGGNLRNASDYPVDLGEYQSQLVYSPHDYGPKVYQQEWFKKDFTEQTLLDDCWQDSWFYIHTENIAPLLIGEWGGFMDGGDNEKYLEIFSEFIAKNGLSHTFWAINANSGDTGGLLKDDWKTWDMEKYNMMKKTLWTDENSGLFVGLDHEIPLGKNGETVTDYYNK